LNERSARRSSAAGQARRHSDSTSGRCKEPPQHPRLRTSTTRPIGENDELTVADGDEEDERGSGRDDVEIAGTVEVMTLMMTLLLTTTRRTIAKMSLRNGYTESAIKLSATNPNRRMLMAQ
jgi:hypothetical protein